jgi:hypothetical protein
VAKIKRNLHEKEKKRLTYNADCKTYRQTKIQISFQKGNENKNGKQKLVGPVIFSKNKNFLLKGVSAGNWWV